LKETKEILEFTQQYKEEGDYILQFMKETTQESKTKHIFTHVLYNFYKNWMKQNYPNEDVVNNRIFCNNLKKMYPNNFIGQVYINGIQKWGIKNIILKKSDINSDSD
jgi:phage/plasmid-associated DNA primase